VAVTTPTPTVERAVAKDTRDRVTSVAAIWRGPGLASLFVLVGTAIVAWAFRRYVLDDAYITYRVAANVAAGHGLVYNTGEQTLTTTAPGYALLLGALARIAGHLPTAGIIVSATALAIAALCLFGLGAGGGGALLLLSAPLLLGTLGMETNAQAACVLAALLAAKRNRPIPMVLALAAAVMLRPDGAVPALLVGLAYLGWCRRAPLPALAVAVIPVAVLYGLLWRAFGSPFPVTLAAKMAQRTLGFYGYLDGLPLWAHDTEAMSQLPAWLLLPPALLLGLGVALSVRREHRWNLVLIAWALAHSAAYVALGVAGYTWYYAPIAAAVASTAGLSLSWAWHVPRRQTGPAPSPANSVAIVVATLCGAAMLAAQARLDVAMVRSLPEPRTALYAEAGDWLAGHTPSHATVGVMEVGVMGFYSGRTMIDFAGLTRPGTTQALARGDIFWSIAHYEPDYLVLSNTDPLYSYDLQDDPWFQATYQPVTGFRDTRWWGSPLTVFARHGPPPNQPVAAEVGSRYGAAVRLSGYALDRTVARPGQFVRVSATWMRLATLPGDWKLFAHVIDDRYKVYSGADVDVFPERWAIGLPVETNQFLAIPTSLAPGRYHVELGWYDPTTLRRLPVTDRQGQRAGEVVVLHTLTVQE